jgi:hypothetical protein
VDLLNGYQLNLNAMRNIDFKKWLTVGSDSKDAHHQPHPPEGDQAPQERAGREEDWLCCVLLWCQGTFYSVSPSFHFPAWHNKVNKQHIVRHYNFELRGPLEHGDQQ